MHIADLLTPDNVVLDLKANDKADLLAKLAKLAASRVPVPEGEIVQALTAREALGSTGMGGGIALPHARLAGVANPTGIFARLKQPIGFDAVDGSPVDLVFLLLLPDFPKSVQLPALACVARGLRDPHVSATVRKAGNQEQMFAAVSARNSVENS
jgi:PTS system nitrogen regulatory IIA component